MSDLENVGPAGTDDGTEFEYIPLTCEGPELGKSYTIQKPLPCSAVDIKSATPNSVVSG